jgi:hypothetical protein
MAAPCLLISTHAPPDTTRAPHHHRQLLHSPPPCNPPGNVAYEADDKALSRLFEPCGVTKVRLHTDKDTGKPKGFAHVHFQ